MENNRIKKIRFYNNRLIFYYIFRQKENDENNRSIKENKRLIKENR